MFSKGMMKSAGKTDEGSVSPRTLDSLSIACLPQIRAFLSIFWASSVLLLALALRSTRRVMSILTCGFLRLNIDPAITKTLGYNVGRDPAHAFDSTMSCSDNAADYA